MLATMPPSQQDHAPRDHFRLAGLIGWPVAQSRSPVIHNHWIDQHALSGRYVPLAVPPARLAAAIAGLPALGFQGCNVTMPHKLAVMPLLHRVNETARRVGAVNTIVVEEDGTLSGANTDGEGFVQSLLDAQPGWCADAGPAVLLGSGGAARAVLVALIEQGARDIRLLNWTDETARAMAAEFGGPGGGRVTPYPWARRHAVLADAALLINATNQGMAGKPPLEIDLDRLSPGTLVADLIYTPPETPFLAAARLRGNQTVNGLGMLLHQARPGFHAWFGVLPAVTPELRQIVAATFVAP
jgi:shikimate dehydrogenase